MRPIIDLDDDSSLLDAIHEPPEDLARRVMPLQRPWQSRQTYRTPKEFIEAVEHRFGPITFDLAAEPDTAWAKHFFTKEDDAFRHDWLDPELGAHLWLNPPFANIEDWAAKCASEIRRAPNHTRAISFLVPASVGSAWYDSYVFPSAHTLALKGRLSFDDIGPYPKDCMLCRFDGVGRKTFQIWDWRNECPR